MIKENIERALVAANEVKKFISGISNAKRLALAEKESLISERERLLRMPLRKDDAMAFVFALIDSRAADYPELAKLPDMFRRFANPSRNGISYNVGDALCLLDLERAKSNQIGNELTFFGIYHPLFNSGFSENAFLYYFGDVVKAKIAEEFGGLFKGYERQEERESIGPPAGERLARIAEIDEAVQQLDAQIEELGRQLRELGVVEANALTLPGVKITAAGEQA